MSYIPLSQSGEPPGPSPSEVEEVTRQILAGKDFAPAEVSPWRQVLDSLGDALLSWIISNPTLARTIGYLLSIILLGMLAVILLRWLRQIWRDGRRGPTRLTLEGSPAWDALRDRASSWQEAVDSALKALQNGDHYQSIWIAHRALLALLDHRGAVQFKKWKTNGDYLREHQDPLLAEMTSAYDSIVYAHRPAEREELSRLLAAVIREGKNVQTPS